MPIVIADGIAAVTDPSTADDLLGEDWDWAAYEQAMNISTLSDLLALRETNPMQARFLANNVPGVALVYGWGYWDKTAVAGTIYTYTIEAEPTLGSTSAQLGSVVAQPETTTPLPAPNGLTGTQVISADLVGDRDWVAAQKNRKADRDIYLRWHVATTEKAKA